MNFLRRNALTSRGQFEPFAIAAHRIESPVPVHLDSGRIVGFDFMNYLGLFG